MSGNVSRLGNIFPDVAIKAPCLVATTAAIILSGLQTIDTVVLADGDRVLVKNQASSVNNGIWQVSTGPWIRTVDASKNTDFVHGTLVVVLEGASNGSQIFELSVLDAPVVIGTSLIVWAPLFSVMVIQPQFVNGTYLTFLDSHGSQLIAPVNLLGAIGPSGASQNFLTRAQAQGTVIDPTLGWITIARYATGSLFAPARYIKNGTVQPLTDAGGTVWGLDVASGMFDLRWGGGGAGDASLDTAAMALAVTLTRTATPAEGGFTIKMPYAFYEFTHGFTIAGAGTVIEGDGPSLTYVKFSPTAAATLFTMHDAAASPGIRSVTLRDFSAFSADTAHAKIFATVQNGDITHFDSIEVFNWSDASHGSIGILYGGRQFCRPSRCRFAANIPIFFTTNPDRPLGQPIDSDLWHSTDLDLIVTPVDATNTQPAITINTGCNVTRMRWDNTSIQGGGHGLYWTETGAATAKSATIIINGFYKEQTTLAASSTILIDFSAATNQMRGVRIQNVDCDAGGNGFIFLGGAGGRIEDVRLYDIEYEGTGAALQMDAGVRDFAWENWNFPVAGATLALTAISGVSPVLRAGEKWNAGAPLPASGSFAIGTRNQVTWKGPADVNGYVAFEYVVEKSLANAGALTLTPFADYTVQVARIEVTAAGQDGRAVFQPGGALAKSFGTANFDVANTASKLCIVRTSDSNVAVVNNLGVTTSILVTVDGAATPN